MRHAYNDTHWKGVLGKELHGVLEFEVTLCTSVPAAGFYFPGWKYDVTFIVPKLQSQLHY